VDHNTTLAKCTKEEMEGIEYFRETTIENLNRILARKKNWGAWAPACSWHGFLPSNKNWKSDFWKIPGVTGITAEQALLSWMKNNKEE